MEEIAFQEGDSKSIETLIKQEMDKVKIEKSSETSTAKDTEIDLS